MTEENIKKECDIDDILCQMQALTHLKGLQSALGEEKFRESFPELEGLGEKLTDKIKNQETSLREALERCKLPDMEETSREELE